MEEDNNMNESGEKLLRLLEEETGLTRELVNLAISDNTSSDKYKRIENRMIDLGIGQVKIKNQLKEARNKRLDCLHGHTKPEPKEKFQVDYDKVKRVFDYFNIIFPDEDERNFLVKYMGTVLADSSVSKDKPFDDLEHLCVLARKNKARKLIILDMNGLFTHRVYNKLNKNGSNIVDINKLPKGGAQIWNFLVWIRPGSKKFIRFLLKHYDIAVWSSMSKWNVDQLVKYVFKNKVDNLKFVWAQSKCKSITHPTNKKKPLFLKNLSEVWKEFPEYDINTTILVDDSNLKAKENPEGTLYKVDEWKGDMNDKEFFKDGSIRKYFENLYKKV